MNEYFSWATLGTYAGAVLATTLITQLLKELPGIAKIPTRIFSYVIAALILIGATIFTAGFSWTGIALACVNAVVISLAANGSYDAKVSILPAKTE